MTTENKKMERTEAYKLYRTIMMIVVTSISLLIGATILFKTGEINFNLQWNMFKSPMTGVLLIIGFFVTLFIKFDGGQVIKVTKYSSGRETREVDHGETLMSNLIGAILFYLVIGPVFFAAVIYYPIVALLSLFEFALPYIVGPLLIIGFPIVFWSITKNLTYKPRRHILFPLVAITFVLLIYYINKLWGIIAVRGLFFDATIYNWVLLIAGFSAIAVYVILELISDPDSENYFIEKPKRVKIPKDEREDGEKYRYEPVCPKAWRNYGSGGSSIVKGALIPTIIFALLLLLPIGKGISESSGFTQASLFSTQSSEQKKISIEKTTGVMPDLETRHDQYNNEPEMPQEHIKRLKLKPATDGYYAMGKVIGSWKGGHLETYLHVVPDHMTVEHALLIDKRGRVFDELKIGVIMAYSGDRGYGEFVDNKVTTYWTYSESEGDHELMKERYRITKKMKFEEIK